jgi:hypothetical protein
VLVRTDDGAVHEVQRPIDLARDVGLRLQRGQDFLPHTGPAPAAESRMDARPLTVALGQVTPGCAGPGDPKHAIDEASVVGTGPPGRGAGQQRLQPLSFPRRSGRVVKVDLFRLGDA